MAKRLRLMNLGDRMPPAGKNLNAMRMLESNPRLWWNIGSAVVLGLMAGCATGPKTTTAPGFVFYPGPPDPPRVQFLTSISGEKDLGGGPGKFASFVTGVTPPQRVIRKPYGLAFSHGQLYVCDTSEGAIAVLDFNQRKFSYLDPKNGKKPRLPINVAVDQDGTRYVADRGHNQVLIFGPDDSYQGAIGEPSAAPPAAGDETAAKPAAVPREQKGLGPTDVLVSADRVYVTDLNQNCVRVYDKAKRELLFKIPVDSKDPAAKLFAPTNLAMDADSCLYVSDFAGFCVKKYDADGKYLRSFGRSGDRPGEFARPKGVAVDRDGRVYVVDAAAQVIQVFDAQGRLLLFFGEPNGSAVPLDLPAKVLIDYDHIELFKQYAAPDFQLEYLVLASNQLGERKVNVYGFGHKK
jgi:DNA-binding beta-propeller fold protein YncE